MSKVTVRVELPQYSLSFDVQVPTSGSVLDIKQAVFVACPGQPRIDGQKLISKGRLLDDGEAVEQLWKSADDSRVVHLAVSPLAWTTIPPKVPAPLQPPVVSSPNPSFSQYIPSHPPPIFPRPQPQDPGVNWIYYLHDIALCVLKRSPPPPTPTEFEREMKRGFAKRLVEAYGRAWPEILDMPYPADHIGGAQYEITVLDGVPYLQLLTPEATPTEAQSHALQVLTYTFPLLSLSQYDSQGLSAGLTTTPTIPPPNLNAADPLQQQLQQLLRDNNVQVQVRAIPVRALLTPLILLSLRTLILLYFYSPTRKPFLAFIMGAWVIYEAWGALRGAMIDPNELDRDGDAQGDAARDRGNGNGDGNRGAGARRADRTSGDILLNRLAGLNADRESLALSSPEGVPPAPAPGLARKIKVFVSLFFMTLHPAYWNRRRAILREREGRIRTEEGAREAVSDSSEGDDRAAQARARMIAQHNRRPMWVREYVDRVMRDEWVDD